MQKAWGATSDFFIRTWSAVVGYIARAIDGAVGAVTGAIDRIRGAISSIGSAIGNVGSSAVSGLGSIFSFDEGGLVPGQTGAPQLAVVHGGEYVLSNDMLRGVRKPAGQGVAATGQPGVADITVNVVLDGKTVHRSVQRQSLRYSVNNPGVAMAGLSIPSGR